MTTPVTGGCACGAIRYEIAAEPMMAGHCHCRDCQYMSGTGHASYAAFPEAAVKLTGEPRFHEAKADSGAISARGFCVNCGSFVMGKSTGMPGMVTVTAGSFDDPSRFQPGLVVYAVRAPGWDQLDPKLASFPRMPPMGQPA